MIPSIQKLSQLGFKIFATKGTSEFIAKHGIKSEILRKVQQGHADGEVTTTEAIMNGSIDLVVNNAGFGIKQPFVGGDIEAEQNLLDVLVTAVMRITHAAMPGMIARDRGGVVNVSSVAGWMSSGTYSAAKSWVISLSKVDLPLPFLPMIQILSPSATLKERF